MIKANHSSFFVHFFNWYSCFMIRHHFRELRFHNTPSSTDKPLLVISNHFSWWDGFLTVHYNRLFLHKRFHVMMLEKQLQNRMFLNKAGAFSIQKNSRSALESLKYAGEILNNPDNLLLMFPQGEIQSQHHNYFRFEKDLETIFHYTEQNLSILFIANLTEYYSQRKPSLDVYFEYFRETFDNTQQLEDAWNDFCNRSVAQQTSPEQ